MRQAHAVIERLRRRAERVGVIGNREYNPGWHTALDLDNLLTVAEAVVLAGQARKESRGAHFRDDFPDKDPAYGAFNFVVRKGADAGMELERVPLAEMPPELRQVIEEEK